MRRPYSSDLARARGLARGLLYSGVMLAAVTAVTLPGCIIPVPLEKAPVPMDHAPAIIPGKEAPPFETPITHTSSEVFEFSLLASDEDVGDTLVARLLRPGNMKNIEFLIYEITLVSSTDPNQAEFRSGAFPPKPYCALLDNPVAPVTITVKVSDRPFTTDPANPTTDDHTDGLSDYRPWILICTGN